MGKTEKDKKDAKAKGADKKKPAMKDILAKKAGGKSKKKKWSKTKSKEKLNNSVFWTKSIWDKVSKDTVAKENYLTPSIVSEKCKVNVSLARQALQVLQEEGKIVPYNGVSHSKFSLFVKSQAFQKEVDAKPVEVDKNAKKGGEKKAPQEKKK